MIIVTFVSRVQEIYHYDSRLLMIIIMRILIIINNNDKSDKREKIVIIQWITRTGSSKSSHLSSHSEHLIGLFPGTVITIHSGRKHISSLPVEP